METKVFRLSIKSLDEDEGLFRGYLSVFGNVDHGGDLVEKGAFAKTLQENKAFPLLWAHSAQDPRSIIGTFHGQEDKHGLLIEGEFFDDAASQEARQKVKALFDRHIKMGLSIGYKALQWKDDKEDEQIIRRLKEIHLYEGSLTLFPMNDQATVQAVKDDSLEQKPYPNNHACVIDPDSKVVGSQTRNHEGKRYTVRLSEKGDHSYLYPITVWTEAEARAHCKSHKGTFEPAAKSKMTNIICANCGERVMEIYDPVSDKDGASDTAEPVKAAIPQEGPPATDEDVEPYFNVLKGKIRDLEI